MGEGSQGTRIGIGRGHPGPDYVRGRMARQLLFLPSLDPLAARWGEDSLATVDSLDAEAAQVDAVLDSGELEPVLGQALGASPLLHYVRGGAPTLGGDDDDDVQFLSRVRRRFFGVTLRDATPTVHELRRIKDGAEVAAIEQAVELTGQPIGVRRP